jgi:hypothetical protein
MYSYNHAQRAVAGGKYGCRKAAAPVFKKALSALDFISKAIKALALPSMPIAAIGGWRIRTCEDLFWALSFVLVAWLLQQGMDASDSTQALQVRQHTSKLVLTHVQQVSPHICMWVGQVEHCSYRQQHST